MPRSTAQPEAPGANTQALFAKCHARTPKRILSEAPFFSLKSKEPPPIRERGFLHYGSNWWTRLRPIRTAAEIQAKIIIEPEIQIPVYQKLAQKVKELRLLGMSFQDIGKSLGIDGKTAIKAYNFRP